MSHRGDIAFLPADSDADSLAGLLGVHVNDYRRIGNESSESLKKLLLFVPFLCWFRQRISRENWITWTCVASKWSSFRFPSRSEDVHKFTSRQNTLELIWICHICGAMWDDVLVGNIWCINFRDDFTVERRPWKGKEPCKHRYPLNGWIIHLENRVWLRIDVVVLQEGCRCFILNSNVNNNSLFVQIHVSCELWQKPEINPTFKWNLLKQSGARGQNLLHFNESVQ